MAWRPLSSDPDYLKAAFADLGLSEIPGKRHSARVLELFKASGHPEINNDETAWCAAAVGGWLAESGYPNSGSLMARSYVKYGRACDLNRKVPRGAIIVWPRGAPPSGHVNICLEDDGLYLTCIGGNQSNANGGGVTVSRERKSRAIAARLPIGVVVKPAALMGDIEDTAEPVPVPNTPVEEATTVVSVDAPTAVQENQIQASAEADTETRGSWLKRKWRGVTGWFSGVGGVGVLGYFTDWRVIAVFSGALFIIAISIVLFMGPGDVRAWVRKQVS